MVTSDTPPDADEVCPHFSGSCFIRTDQLDGETDWKLKVAVACTQRLLAVGVRILDGVQLPVARGRERNPIGDGHSGEADGDTENMFSPSPWSRFHLM